MWRVPPPGFAQVALAGIPSPQPLARNTATESASPGGTARRRVRLLGAVLSNVCSCMHACTCMFLQEHGRYGSPQVCVHRCPVCVVPLSACGLVRDGWVWVPLTAPGPALFWGYQLHASLERQAGRQNPSSHRAITSGSFISHLLLVFEESRLESGQGKILLKSPPLSTNILIV